MFALRLRYGSPSEGRQRRLRVRRAPCGTRAVEANSSRTTMNGVAVRVALGLGVDLSEHFADDLGRLVGREGVAAL
jgi:hypothetical protein